MKTLQLDNNHNMIIDNMGNISLLENIQALAQDISTGLLLNSGENPYNIAEGINYDENILGKMGGIDYIRDQFINSVNQQKEVINIANITVENTDTTLAITADINTIYGVLTL